MATWHTEFSGRTRSSIQFNLCKIKKHFASVIASFATKSGYASGIRVTDAGLISTHHIYYSDEKSITIFARSQRQ